MSQNLKNIPGPPPTPLIGNLVDFVSSQPHELFSKYSNTYGDVVLFWLLNSPNILISNPADLEKILVADMEDFYKDSPRVAMEPLLKDDLFIRNGQDDWAWKRQEHPFSQVDRDSQFNRLLPSLGEIVNHYFLALSKSQQPIDLWSSLLEMFFQVWSQGILGISPDSQAFTDYRSIMNTAAARLAFPVTINPVFWQSVKRWHDYFAEKVKQSAREGDKIAILNRQFCQRTNLSPEQLEVQISTIFIAGVHPTATTLFSVFYLLFHHPEVKAQLRAEIGDFNRLNEADLTLESLNGLTYLDRVLNETLRLYSTVPLSQRVVAPNRLVKLGDYEIPGGTTIWFSSWAVHRNPKYWSEPLRFIPDRFQTPPPTHHFFPFGIGPRRCVGRPWALTLLKLSMAVLLSKFEVEIDPHYTYETQFGPALFVPKKRLNARVVAIQP